MEGTGQTNHTTHIIFAGDVSKVPEAFRTSQNSGSLNKIILIIPNNTSNKFKNLRNELSNYCTEFEVKDVDISDVDQCALWLSMKS